MKNSCSLFEQWRAFMYSMLMILVGLVAVTPQTHAGERFSPFVQEQYYLGNGKEVVPLEAFAAEPQKYLRSEAAYVALRKHFADALGESDEAFTDERFATLLGSDQVRLQQCVGRKNTAGINPAGVVRWRERSCYPNEYLIAVKVKGEWLTVASQGCYNPVEFVRPPAVAEQPPIELKSPPELVFGVMQEETYHPGTVVVDQEVQGFVLPSWCGPGQFIPGSTTLRQTDGFRSTRSVPADRWN